jgi:hypothetical protein
MNSNFNCSYMTMSSLTYILVFSVRFFQSVYSVSSHLEWRAGLSDTILKWDYPKTIPAKFGLIWFSGFREEDLNVIFYQNNTTRVIDDCLNNVEGTLWISQFLPMSHWFSLFNIYLWYFIICKVINFWKACKCKCSFTPLYFYLHAIFSLILFNMSIKYIPWQ